MPMLECHANGAPPCARKRPRCSHVPSALEKDDRLLDVEGMKAKDELFDDSSFRQAPTLPILHWVDICSPVNSTEPMYNFRLLL
jgi:hypothetical protein